jgi:murein L,D-transpeptidase YcbB/YkuD
MVNMTCRRIFGLLLCSFWLVPAAASSPHVGEAAERFYELRDDRPAWNDAGAIEGLAGAIEGLAADGLLPEHYDIAALRRGAMQGWSRQLERRATQSLLLALSDLDRGHVDPATLHSRWNLAPRKPLLDVSEVSDALDRGQLAQLLARARPTHPVYARLREALARLREIQLAGGYPRIGEGPTLELGTQDPRVRRLRQRLVLGGYLDPQASDSDVFDEIVEGAVRRFQEEQYLEVDGKVGPQTRRELDIPVRARIDQLRVNLERARWLLPRITGDFVLVDVPGFKVRFFRNGEPIWTSRAQVGRDVRRTPILQAEITEVTLNPTWTVPPTIKREDIIPKARVEPAYLAHNHIRVFNARGQELDPRRVDWNRAEGLTFRQDAGPENALGRIRINFPNRHTVFMHETPHLELFEKHQRAFSSGCIRVEQPFELADLLFDAPFGSTRHALGLTGGATLEFELPRRVPILILYWTVDLHDGRVAFKPDLYELDAPTLAALGKSPAD